MTRIEKVAETLRKYITEDCGVTAIGDHVLGDALSTLESHHHQYARQVVMIQPATDEQKSHVEGLYPEGAELFNMTHGSQEWEELVIAKHNGRWILQEHNVVLSEADLQALVDKFFKTNNGFTGDVATLFKRNVPEKPFNAFEVHGCTDFGNGIEQVDDEEADFFSVYLHTVSNGLECIGDFQNRDAANRFVDLLTNIITTSTDVVAIKQWKEEAMKINLPLIKLMQEHPDAPLGEHPFTTAIKFIKERDALRCLLNEVDTAFAVLAIGRDHGITPQAWSAIKELRPKVQANMARGTNQKGY